MIWPTVAIGEIACLLRNGMSIKQSPGAGGMPITRIETIAFGSVNLSRCGYAGLERKDCSAWLLEHGDILISHINSLAHLGKCAIFEERAYEVVHGMNLLNMRVDQSVAPPRFILHALRSKRFVAQISTIAKKSVNQASFNISTFKELEIPLPPLEEQRRIAAILDKADSLQSKRRRCLGHIDLLLKSIFIDMFGDPVSNSMGWESRNLVESLELINGRAFKSSEWSNSGLPIIRIQNVKRPEEVFNRYLGSWESKHLVKKGDILLCWAGQLVSIGVHQWDREDGLLNQHIFKVIPKFEAEPKFIAFMLSLVIDQAKANFRGTDMKHLTKADLARQTIILPPISIQRRFALLADCMESMRVSQVSHLERINSVSSSLTTLAFHGSFSRWSGDEIVCA